MLKVSSINHYAPSFKANNNKSTGYFTKFGYIAPDSFVSSNKQGIKVAPNAKIASLGILGKTVIKDDETFFIPNNIQSIVKRSEKAYAHAEQLIGESMSKISEAVDLGDGKKVLEEFSTGKKPELLRRTTVYPDGTILIDDTKSKIRVVRDKCTTDVSLGVDYNHIGYDSIWSRETFGFNGSELCGYMSDVQADFDGYGVEAGEYMSILNNQLRQFAKGYKQSYDGTCAADKVAFLDRDGDIYNYYKDYMTYYDGTMSARVAYDIKDGAIVSCTKNYIELSDVE